MDVVDEGPLDPRIQIELENLNVATDNINKLEIELDEANTAHKQLLSEISRRLTEIYNKLGASCIEKSRCYYEALDAAQQARVECQKLAQLFQRANEMLSEAKKKVSLAETKFMVHQHNWNFDQTWQDVLNQATIKVMDAETQKAEYEREHQRKAMLSHEAEKKVQQLEEKHRRAILKASPYFEMKAHCDQMLATQKERVDTLKKAVKEAKTNYSSSLRILENISNQIHQQRRDYDILFNGPREPGVGAELVNVEENLHYETVFNKLKVGKVSSFASNESKNEERKTDIQDIHELRQRIDVRSADGSESTNNPWEVELEASIEKLNNLSLERFNERDEKISSTSYQDNESSRLNKPEIDTFDEDENR
ncbi:SH3 domain-binding protein 5 homolog isoform X2 [Prorops nasuta]|uniref:SH3 domain-binding protein 5 homolog isoform X2 n=1 Tax=Prorops nasuta TaxID=863751 RepID=UPI0034CFBF85